MNYLVSLNRGEMYDRDVQLIQFCAATLPPNTFILHCLNKFNLINCASKDFAVSEEESIRFSVGSLYYTILYSVYICVFVQFVSLLVSSNNFAVQLKKKSK